jgi:hypothetical protein
MAKKNIVTKEEIIEALNKEIQNYDWMSYSIEIGKMNPWMAIAFLFDSPMGAVHSTEPLVQFFPENIVKNINDNPVVRIILGDSIGGKIARFINRIFGHISSKEEAVDYAVRNIVRHEHRHVQQYTFIKSIGLNPEEILKNEENLPYMDRPLEKDAYSYAEGNVVPIEEALAVYVIMANALK